MTEIDLELAVEDGRAGETTPRRETRASSAGKRWTSRDVREEGRRPPPARATLVRMLTYCIGPE
jgi:hypothetical protein